MIDSSLGNNENSLTKLRLSMYTSASRRRDSIRSSISSEGYLGTGKEYTDRDTDTIEENDDEIAKVMKSIFSSSSAASPFAGGARSASRRSSKAAMEVKIAIDEIERISIIESIDWLGRHVPQCVLKQLGEEVLVLARMEKHLHLNLNLNSHAERTARNEKNILRRRSSTTASIMSDCTTTRAPMEMPHATQYKAALLFIDMSGFTKISQKLDVESLSKAINSYFQAIVDEVTSHGGDILKFAGDAIFAEWRAEETQTHEHKAQKSCLPSRAQSLLGASATKEIDAALEECVHTAAICGAMVVKKCADYPIYAKSVSGVQGEKIATLNVHCGLGVGKMVGVHVGNEYNRREYLVFGNPIDQVAEACDSAELGELRASTEALKYLNRTQASKHVVKCEKGEKSAIIASGKNVFFGKKVKKAWSMKKKSEKKTIQPTSFTIPYDEMDTTSLKFFQKLLSFYVHPVVVEEEDIDHSGLQSKRSSFVGSSTPGITPRRSSLTRLDSSITTRTSFLRQSSQGTEGNTRRGSIVSQPFSDKSARRSSMTRRDSAISSAQERLRSEAELRSVFTIFIMPKIEAKLTDDPVANKKTFQLLNDIMNIVTSILDNYKGHLRQYIVDDKGVVLIATFGLRGSTFPNMVSERALPTCRLIHSALTSELGVDNQIGATLGKVYCGVVGGVERHEFAVLGPSVNLAARLMAQKNHPGVLVDNLVRSKARKFNFIAFPPVKAKGYADLVPVFRPLTAKETRWGKVNMRYVGRKDEMDHVCNIALEMSQQECPSKMFFVWGESGSGKSSFVVHTIAKMHKALTSARKKSIITRSVCSESDNLVPFSMLRSIFRDVLREKPMADEESLASMGAGSYRDREWDSGSLSSLSTLNSQKTSVIGRLREICEEMDAPSGMAEIIGHHIRGNSKHKISSVEKAPELADIVSFMAQVFIRSTSHAEVVILALDDVQWMDNLSWKVLRSIFEESTNIFIVSCARPIEAYSLTMDDDFWEMLTEKFREEGRYDELRMEHLAKSEVREMASLTLKCDPDDILDKFIDDIHMHSDGNPYFASEILQNCVRNNLTRRFGDNKIGWRPQRRNSQEGLQFTNLNELLLQRVDNLDDLTRKVLHFASVLGASFEFREIVEISEHILCTPPEERDQLSIDISAALQTAVEEGILDEVLQENECISDDSDLIQCIVINGEGECEKKKEEKLETRKIYSFYHSTWQRLILSLLLDSWKRDIHKHAALAIEARSPDVETRDYRTNVKLFQHWKESENTVKAADLGLVIGQNYKMLGLTQESVNVYDDALDMWKKVDPADGEDSIAGFAPDVLESLDEENLVHLIKLLTMLAQAIGSTSKKEMQVESANTFVDALTILRYAPVGAEIKDRAFIFPIYSGMFFLLKYGVPVPYSENELIANFVNETKKHGDPVHYGRALAMQGETYHRQGRYEEAIQSHMELKRVYDVEKHHALVVASYASDRVGQNFGCAANCYMRLDQLDKAMDIVDHIITYLIPKMDPKNVHNSVVTIYPAIWILKDHGRAEKAREIFLKFVLEPFREHYGEDGTTPFKPTFRGLEILLDLVLYMEGKRDSFDEQGYFDWALDINQLECAMGIDIAIGNFGRSPMSINAEVCLRLSKLALAAAAAAAHEHDSVEKAKKLIENGMRIAEKAISGCDGSKGSHKMLTTYLQIKPVYDEIRELHVHYLNFQ